MNKATFLKVLEGRLKGLPKEEKSSAVEYYAEYFMDAGVGENDDVLPLVGTPEQVARKIISECTDKTMKAQKEDGGAKNNAMLIWLVILGICAMPIALPIAIVLCAMVFVIVVVGLSLLVALFCTGIGITAVFIGMIPGIFWAETAGQALVIAGLSCIGISLGILFCVLFVKLVNLFIRAIAKLLRKIFSKRTVA